MITQQQIDETVTWDGLKDFGRFVLRHCEGDSLPDYKKMDLMEVPKLVPYIWVYDLRCESNVRDLTMGFAGEQHTQLHGRNVSGTSDAHIFRDYGFNDEIVEHYYKSIHEKRTAYIKRDTELKTERRIKHRNIESLFFPCSSDGENVNWGIGCLTWEVTTFEGERAFLYF